MKKTYSYLPLLLVCWAHQMLYNQAKSDPQQTTIQKIAAASKKTVQVY